MLHRINKLCTNCDVQKTNLIFTLLNRLEDRGYDRPFLLEIYKKIQRTKSRQILLNKKTPANSNHFFHLTYFPKAKKGKSIQKAFFETISHPIHEPPLLHLTNV